MSNFRVLLATIVGCILLCSSNGFSAPPTSQVTALPTFTLHDFLGRGWQNELVFYPVSNQLHGRQDLTLFGPDNKPQAYQWATNGSGKKCIAFAANVSKFGESTYRLQSGKPIETTDVQVSQEQDTLRLGNELTGIAIRRDLSSQQGPLAGVKLRSGDWIGDSSLDSDLPLESYSARVIEQGPVFAEILCVASFNGGRNWRLRVRLQAGEPVVVMQEAYNVGEKTRWTFNLSDKFSPQHLLYRSNKNRLGEVTSWKIEPSSAQAATQNTLPAFLLEPWVHWNSAERQGNWFALYNDKSSDLLTVAALNGGLWIDPQENNYNNAQVSVSSQADATAIEWPLQNGRRRWMIGALDKESSLAILNSGNLQQATPPQQYLVKYGDFPLDMVKDYVLQWPADKSLHPRLMVSQQDVARERKSFKPDPEALKSYMALNVQNYNMEPAIRYYVGSRDAALGRKFAEAGSRWVQDEVDRITQQNSHMSMGFAPFHLANLVAAIYLLDAVWDTGLTPEERERVSAQLAFLGYTLARSDFWSPERGYGGNPNMTTSVRAYQATLGAMLKSHPAAKSWLDAGMSELKEQLDNWSDDNGGWLEAPHYSLVAHDLMTGLFLMAHNAGFNDYIYDPKMKKWTAWFAQISTPPDPRSGGLRHVPPLGNTYLGEPTGLFGVMATIWKDRDPQFASEMQWMYHQQGSWPDHGIGGLFPGLIGYRAMLIDPDIPEKKPDYQSTLFPKTGVMLRNGVGDRETQMHMIAGDNHAHYDRDSGSITLWGKGRPIADDFGYQGQAPINDHNMVDTPVGNYDMQVQEFTPLPNFDYVHGLNRIWHRRIAFIKDEDFMAPNYIVIRDTTEIPAPMTWRLWLDAAKVLLSPQSATVEGKQDVDTDIIFITPDNVELTTEEKTRETAGLNEKAQVNVVKRTAIGLIAPQKRGRGYFAVIYPRLKNEKPAEVTPIAGGQAVMVKTAAGTDYVFLGEKPFTYTQGDISFEGTAGLIKMRGPKTYIALGTTGKLQAGGQKTEMASAKYSKITPPERNSIFNGDSEAGTVPIFHAEGGMKVSLYEGNPVPDDTEHKGKYCVAMTPPDGVEGTFPVQLHQTIFVDPTKTYHVSMRFYAPEPRWLLVGGYATDGNERGVQLPWPGGEGTWQWDVRHSGKTEGWKTIEATIGPPGSDAKFTWPDNTLTVTFGIWTSGVGTLYVDDLSVEPVEN